MRILYITYIDFGEYLSGSSVRPQKMYDAMQKEGHEVFLLESQQNNFRKRTKAIIKFWKLINNKIFDICYVELPSGPIFNPLDKLLLKKINKMGISIGIFYRDAFWLFGKSMLKESWFKIKAICLMQKRDIKLFQRLSNIVYFPTESIGYEITKIYPFKRWDILPPGTEIIESMEYVKTKTGIYVGASSKDYGVEKLIEAYKHLHDLGYNYKLVIVTREKEFNNLFKSDINYGWLKILFASGEELINIYKGADVAFLPMEKTKYMDLAMSVKLCEYLSFGKPIISNNLSEMGTFVVENNCGVLYDETIEELSKVIIDFYQHNMGDRYYKNVIKTRETNLWQKRVNKIIMDIKIN